MKARYQYKIYPTAQQRKELARVFGCCRVVYNDALALCKQSDKLPSNGDLQKVCITQVKKTVQREWLSKVSNILLQQSIADLGVAYKNYFEFLKGKKKRIKVKLPKFKKKDNRQTARFRKGGFSIKNGIVYLAKIGNFKTVWSRLLPERVGGESLRRNPLTPQISRGEFFFRQSLVQNLAQLQQLKIGQGATF